MTDCRTDGLVFYDQFGRLKPYQITLVSVGVAILLLGVWVVSLIRPAGDGIEVGTWVEDEDESETCDPVLGGEYHDDPESMEESVVDAGTIESQTPTQPSHSRRRSTQTTPPSPTSATFVSSPLSPLSPLSPSTRRRHPPRYGTLMPEYAPIGAPTGFSIGLGAASPGFVLRPSPIAGGHRRGRTQSEGQAGILAIMEQGGAAVERAEAGASRSDIEQDETPRSQAQTGAGTGGAGHRRRQSWWAEAWQKRNKSSIQLPSEDER